MGYVKNVQLLEVETIVMKKSVRFIICMQEGCHAGEGAGVDS